MQAPHERDTSKLKEHMTATWRGVLKRGLAQGDLDDETGELHPHWASAPWMLAPPERAVPWAHNYERAYPGALAALGIPPAAWHTPADWLTWLHS